MSNFMKKCDTEKKKIVDELADGKYDSLENISKRSNSRDDLGKAIISLASQLVEAKKWIETIHSTHFELLNQHIRMRDMQEDKTLDAIEKLDKTLEHKLAEKVSVTSNIESKHERGKSSSQPNVPDWTKIDFKTSISEAVSKSIRIERRKEKELADKKSNFIFFGVKPEDIQDKPKEDQWDSYNSLVRYVVDDCDLDMDNDIVKCEKIGNSEAPPIRVIV